MRILTKVAYLFQGENGNKFKTKPLEICSAPDWIANDNTFKIALKSGNIEVMNRGLETNKIEKVLGGASGTVVQQIEQVSKNLALDNETGSENELIQNEADEVNQGSNEQEPTVSESNNEGNPFSNLFKA